MMAGPAMEGARKGAMDGRVICVGIAVLDQVYTVDRLPDEAGKHFARGYAEVGGGPAANAAVTAARLGGRAALWARLGSDAVGRRIIEDLAAEGVATGHIRTHDGHRSGVSAVLVDAEGERLIVNYADPDLPRAADWLPLDEVSAAGCVLADIRWPDAALAMLGAARDVGVPGVLDADRGPDPVGADLLAAASHVVFSAPGLAQSVGHDGLEEGLAEIAGVTDGWLAVTAGADGVVWRHGEETGRVPAVPVEPVDTLGAGDVFHGAFALALARGQAPVDSCRYAAAAAALKCTRPGGRMGFPTAGDLDRFMEERAA
jgi:sulfofructose kinase